MPIPQGPGGPLFVGNVLQRLPSGNSRGRGFDNVRSRSQAAIRLAASNEQGAPLLSGGFSGKRPATGRFPAR